MTPNLKCERCDHVFIAHKEHSKERRCSVCRSRRIVLLEPDPPSDPIAAWESQPVPIAAEQNPTQTINPVSCNPEYMNNATPVSAKIWESQPVPFATEQCPTQTNNPVSCNPRCVKATNSVPASERESQCMPITAIWYPTYINPVWGTFTHAIFTNQVPDAKKDPQSVQIVNEKDRIRSDDAFSPKLENPYIHPSLAVNKHESRFVPVIDEDAKDQFISKSPRLPILGMGRECIPAMKRESRSVPTIVEKKPSPPASSSSVWDDVIPIAISVVGLIFFIGVITRDGYRFR